MNLFRPGARKWLAALVLPGALVFLGACRRSTDASPDTATNPVPTQPKPTASTVGSKAPTGMEASPLDSTNVLRAYTTRGVIRDLPGGSTLVIRHEEIPGFMPKMTMQFHVRDTNELRGLAVGDTVAFVLKATQEESWIEGLRRAGTNEPVSSVPNDPTAMAILHANHLKPGDPLPDGELLAEDGRTVKFSDFRGRALAFTFIFTRCPLPDYCPRMSRHFSRAREILLQKASGPDNWQFLSISFDPEFDQPGVLSRYAYSYRGGITNQWLFAAAPTNVLAALAPQLDFRFGNQEGSFQHNLRTVVLDTQGRLHRSFEGNKWTAEELADAIAEAALR